MVPEIEEIIDTSIENQFRKRYAKLKQQLTTNEPKWEPRNRRHFEIYRKKDIPKALRKTMPNGAAKKEVEYRPRCA